MNPLKKHKISKKTKEELHCFIELLDEDSKNRLGRCAMKNQEFSADASVAYRQMTLSRVLKNVMDGQPLEDATDHYSFFLRDPESAYKDMDKSKKVDMFFSKRGEA